MHKPVDGAEALAREVLGKHLEVDGFLALAKSARGYGLESMVAAMLAHSAALVAENERLERDLAKRNRTATDRMYMIDALVQMLGPKGLQVWNAWRDQGVERLHTSWGWGAAALTGEGRAEVHLKLIEAMKNAVPIDNIDGDTPQVDLKDLIASIASENDNG